MYPTDGVLQKRWAALDRTDVGCAKLVISVENNNGINLRNRKGHGLEKLSRLSGHTMHLPFILMALEKLPTAASVTLLGEAYNCY